jgi:hypothetical protein
MSFFDRLMGRGEQPESQPRQPEGGSINRQGGQLSDQQALDRYRYMLRTAPPETIEQAHEEAFAQLTPEQRRMLLQQLSANLPEYERGQVGAQQDDPRTLARLATRAEMRQPGTLERTFNSMPVGGMGMGGMGMGFGGLMAGSFLSSLAGVVAGSMIANAFFDHSGYDQGYGQGLDNSGDPNAGDFAGQGADGGYSNADAVSASDTSGDYNGSDFGGASTGDFGDMGDMGGDFGGDFGGGDF